jgi:hypothetical protein
MELTKAEKKKIYNKENKEKIYAQAKVYRLKNKEKIAIYQKAYRIENKEKVAARQKRWKIANKEKRVLYNKEYEILNKERRAGQKKEYYVKNKDKMCARNKLWRVANKDKLTISDWKRSGLIADDYQAIYNLRQATTHCDLCKVLLTTNGKGSTQRCMDHNHLTGAFRNIVCTKCNSSSALSTKNTLPP